MKLRTKLNKASLKKKSLVKLSKKLQKSKQSKKTKNSPTAAPEPQVSKQYKKVQPYASNDTILLVGEGNLSFACALSSISSAHITPTIFDSRETLEQKYPDASSNVELLEEYGVDVLFNVDACSLEKVKQIKNKRFTKIVFNFPHHGKGIKDVDINVFENQKLIAGFLASARFLLASRKLGDECDGEIHLTVKGGAQYDLWNVKKIAKQVGLVCKTSWKFHPELYPGYVHRRTLGYKEGVSEEGNEEILKNPPRTYCFAEATEKTLKQQQDSDQE